VEKVLCTNKYFFIANRIFAFVTEIEKSNLKEVHGFIDQVMRMHWAAHNLSFYKKEMIY
jgi:hypothetical protein